MGTKITKKHTRAISWSIVHEPGPVAQVAHPISLEWTPTLAIKTLNVIAEEVSSSVRLLVAGGGYILLKYPRIDITKATLRRPEFLSKLHSWVVTQLSDIIQLADTDQCEFIIGVDVEVNESGTGQFVLWIGSGGESALTPKRFPVGDEDKFLAGVDALHPFPYPRVVTTQVGPALLLVCHDAQAYNHRNRANVKRAKRVTARRRAIEELDRARKIEGLKWAFNVVHWIEDESNTRTFRISYSQLRQDFPGNISVAAGIGYDDKVSQDDVPELLDRMIAPFDMPLSKVVIHY